MGAAAELRAPAACIDNATTLPYFSPNSAIAPIFSSFLNGQVLHGDRQGLVDLLIHAALDLGQLGGGHSAEMGKVKVGQAVILIAAGLMDMLFAQNLAQSLLQQVGSRVVAADSGAASRPTEAGVTSSSTWMVPSQQLAEYGQSSLLRGLFDLRDLQLGITADKGSRGLRPDRFISA